MRLPIPTILMVAFMGVVVEKEEEERTTRQEQIGTV
jgi:hypothetical protein